MGTIKILFINLLKVLGVSAGFCLIAYTVASIVVFAIGSPIAPVHVIISFSIWIIGFSVLMTFADMEEKNKKNIDQN